MISGGNEKTLMQLVKPFHGFVSNPSCEESVHKSAQEMTQACKETARAGNAPTPGDMDEILQRFEDGLKTGNAEVTIATRGNEKWIRVHDKASDLWASLRFFAQLHASSHDPSAGDRTPDLMLGKNEGCQLGDILNNCSIRIYTSGATSPSTLPYWKNVDSFREAVFDYLQAHPKS